MYILGYPLLSLVSILDGLLMIYSLVVLIACVLSWVNPDPTSPIVRVLGQLTEPVFMYIRRYVPTVNGIDLAPLVILVAIFFMRNGILPIFDTFASRLIG